MSVVFDLLLRQAQAQAQAQQAYFRSHPSIHRPEIIM
jgi:hypothetical protein